MQSPLVLLLTATIDPGSTPLVARSDPSVRLRDYEKALVTWLSSEATLKIVMYENSGSDIGSLKSIASRYPRHEVEFHSFQADEAGKLKGKGYSELHGIARVLQTSVLLQNCTYVAKCTGRLTVRNARALFDLIEGLEFDVMCTLRMNLGFANSRLFIATPAFLKDYLMPQAEIIDDLAGTYLEHALACAVGAAISHRKKWLPFPVFPVIRGISGTSNQSQSFSGRKTAIHSMFHLLETYVYRRNG